MWKTQLFELNYDGQESIAAKDVIDSGWITMGEKTQAFENTFADTLGQNVYATALSSGTAALHIALLSADLAPGDEVIIPGLTFVADINVVKLVGAKPVLADCDSYENWNVSARTLAEKITDKTKAIIVVHYAGYPCDMDAIVQLCRDHNLMLIEDVAHAPGAYYKGRACGTFGDIACFSFFTNKNLSVGEGGMLTTRSEALNQKARHFRSHGMTSLTLDRHKGRAITYDVTQPGLNYRIDEMRSAIGLVQLAKLKKANAQRKALVEGYIERLSNCPKISIPLQNLPDIESAYHIFPILLDPSVDRVKLIQALKTAGIQTSIHYPSFHQFSAFLGLNLGNTPLADDIAARELTLPLFPTMSLDQLDLVTNNLKTILSAG